MSDSIKLHTMDLFSRFFQENQEKFLTFAYSYLRDKAEAEDVLMESMIALWENRNRWKEGSNLHALLLTIIKNKSLNLLEHKKIRLQAEENINSHNQRELNLRISTLKACEPEQIFDNEIQHIVHKALEQMPQHILPWLSELAEDKVPLVIVVVDAFRILQQPSSAQLKYRLSRLTGLGRSMSRLGGGIGTRGPGEKKLEIDRRLINDRIAQLNRELKEVVKHREIARAKRERNAVPVVAIVGYTNAGKSTLLNHLTDAEVLEEDKLFATLDPTTRMLELEGHQQVLLTDTVGFIRKLPHHLIEAFKSTLEEAKYADYIIHVVDASNPQRDKQMYIVYETLDHLGVKNKKILTLFNKIDIRTDDQLQDFRADHVLQISATENAGLDAVKDVLQEMLREDKIYIERVIPYAQAGVLQLVRNKGELVSEEYVPEGISIRAYVPMEVYGKL